LVTYQNYTKMHGPENIKKVSVIIGRLSLLYWEGYYLRLVEMFAVKS
jgi:hypothetical protein